MHRQAKFIRWSLAYLLLSSTATVLAVDIEKLPMISNGYISINNDFDFDVPMEVTPQGCALQHLTVRSHSSIVVGCAGAKTVHVYIRWIRPDGTPIPNEQDLPVDTHYTFTWSDETKGYTRLSSVFDSQGGIIR